ncbi:PREDICTED: epidermis-specific secreted glycoprotein EP1-like isoform X2 [Tarenaya hassleriana]|uniref:epidermis-specific secreted glycoprotein EP1-like isoform X1 n=1 Tax=Tarenaya hassleriana TaxID=28532 RepID=UPI00053C86D2|nr:PREDICTED: epidermis-specific secreted glycoprotein EP1-like isoform X1 [Tarenaya hassleriana]XP_010540153.1 PREDICTED: epidermis-specific secreted glycoprotein EP1-like isoform X2 [Tarenaya hassleriana]
METSSFPLALSLFFFLLLGSRAKVPPAEQFQFTNKGGFLDYSPIEYGATVRGFLPVNDNFRLSFYNTTPNAYTLALRMGNRAQESTLRWVWEANRGNPVRENAVLTFGEDGNLVLAEVNGRVAWQTNTANKGVVGIKVLENGNMVLYDAKGNFVWQSFDFPTDTLLVGQSLKANGRNKLVSRLSRSVNVDGPYSLVMEPKRLVLYYTTNMTQKPIAYYEYEFFTKINTRFESMTFKVKEDAFDTTYGMSFEGKIQGSQFNASAFLSRPKHNATLSFIRLESDGNVRVYSYSTAATATAWDVTYTAFTRDDFDGNDDCRLATWCGDFGLCRKSQCNACPTDKGLTGWDETCRPPKLTSCDPKTFHYFKLEGVDHFMTKYNGGSTATENGCGDKCTKDCKCMGFFYNRKSSKCWLGYELKTLTKSGDASQVAYVKAPNGK